MRQAKLNATFNFAHVAALNPTGEALKFLIANNHEYDITHNHQTTAHFAAVCPTDANI